MSEVSITRQLFSARGITIRSLMRLPTIYLGGTTATVQAYPVIIISYEPPANQPYSERPKDAFYKVTPRNQYRVVRFFRHVLNWFEDPTYEGLYILDEHTGKVIVNMELRNLQERLGSMDRYDNQSLLAIPAVIEQDSVQSEGCALCINRTNYVMPLRDEQVASIYGILDTFSFQAETTMLLQIASHPELYTKEPPKRFNRSGSSYDPQGNVDPTAQFKPKVVW